MQKSGSTVVNGHATLGKGGRLFIRGYTPYMHLLDPRRGSCQGYNMAHTLTVTQRVVWLTFVNIHHDITNSGAAKQILYTTVLGR